MEYVSAGCHNLEVLDISDCHQKTDLVIKHVVKFTDLQVLKINFSTHVTGSKLYLISLYLPHLAELQLKNCRDLDHVFIDELHSYMPHLKIIGHTSMPYGLFKEIRRD
jgi:hypothetical protein